MTTIKDLNHQIQTLQAKAEGEAQQAQRERDKADGYRNDNNPQAMQAHSTASAKHDQNALQFQNQVNDLHIKIQQLQTQASHLMEQRNALAQTHQQDLITLNKEIEHLTGEPQN